MTIVSNIHHLVLTKKSKTFYESDKLKVEFFPNEKHHSKKLQETNINKMESENIADTGTNLKVEFFPNAVSPNQSKKLPKSNINKIIKSKEVTSDNLNEVVNKINKMRLPVYDIEFQENMSLNPESKEFEFEENLALNPGIATEMERINGGNEAHEANFPWMVRISGGCAGNSQYMKSCISG